MKTILIIAITLIAISAIATFSLLSKQSLPQEPSQILSVSWKENVLQNLTTKVLSSDDYHSKLAAIQNTVSQTNLGRFSQIAITGLKSDYSDGEQVQFGLAIFGYYDWCLLPSLSVYYEKYDKPIWDGSISISCPPPMEYDSPRIFYWKSTDFNQFPTCRYEGIHKIMGQSVNFGPKEIGQYYCHGTKQFHPPKTIQMTIPPGASNAAKKANFEPSEISVDWSDYINLANNDSVTHVIIGESERTKHTDGVEFEATLEPGQTFQIKALTNGTNWLYSSTQDDNRRFDWMEGTIHVN